MAGGARICLGQIGAAHGVAARCACARSRPIRGDRRLRPARNRGRPRVPDRSRCGRPRITSSRALPASATATPPSALANAKLYVPRERLPEPDATDEFYHADLIGLAAVDPAGNELGTVVAVHNFGAGDLIEVQAVTARQDAVAAVRRGDRAAWSISPRDGSWWRCPRSPSEAPSRRSRRLMRKGRKVRRCGGRAS